jgi:hypothetical protein
LVKEWCTQPRVGKIPAGNVLISAGILTTGSSPSKVCIYSTIMYPHCLKNIPTNRSFAS